MSVSHEQLVLGALLKHSAYVALVDLKPEEFTTDAHVDIYNAILKTADDNPHYDFFLVAETLKQAGINHDSYIADLTTSHLSDRTIGHYVENIRKTARKQKIKDIGERMLNDDSFEAEEAIEQLLKIGDTRTQTSYDAKQLMSMAVDYIDERFNSDGSVPGIPTGIKLLDECLGGFHDSDLIVVGARPAMGKTAFLLNLALNSGVSYGIISHEQSAQQAAVRMVCIDGNVSNRSIRSGQLEERDFAKATSSITKLSGHEIVLDDSSTTTIRDVTRLAQQWKVRHGIKILFVDYLQHIKPTDRSSPKTYQVEEIAQGLKSIAKQLNIPVVALAQVSRECEKQQDKRPNMGHLSDSSAIEKEADQIMFLYRDEVYNPETDQPGTMEISVSKNRHGAIGNVLCSWSGDSMRVKDLETRYYKEQDYGY